MAYTTSRVETVDQEFTRLLARSLNFEMYNAIDAYECIRSAESMDTYHIKIKRRDGQAFYMVYQRNPDAVGDPVFAASSLAKLILFLAG